MTLISLVYGFVGLVVFAAFLYQPKGNKVDNLMVAIFWLPVLLILTWEYCKKLFRKELKPS